MSQVFFGAYGRALALAAILTPALQACSSSQMHTLYLRDPAIAADGVKLKEKLDAAVIQNPVAAERKRFDDDKAKRERAEFDGAVASRDRILLALMEWRADRAGTIEKTGTPATDQLVGCLLGAAGANGIAGCLVTNRVKDLLGSQVTEEKVRTFLNRYDALIYNRSALAGSKSIEAVQRATTLGVLKTTLAPIPGEDATVAADKKAKSEIVEAVPACSPEEKAEFLTFISTIRAWPKSDRDNIDIWKEKCTDYIGAAVSAKQSVGATSDQETFLGPDLSKAKADANDTSALLTRLYSAEQRFIITQDALALQKKLQRKAQTELRGLTEKRACLTLKAERTLDPSDEAAKELRVLADFLKAEDPAATAPAAPAAAAEDEKDKKKRDDCLAKYQVEVPKKGETVAQSTADAILNALGGVDAADTGVKTAADHFKGLIVLPAVKAAAAKIKSQSLSTKLGDLSGILECANAPSPKPAQCTEPAVAKNTKLQAAVRMIDAVAAARSHLSPEDPGGVIAGLAVSIAYQDYLVKSAAIEADTLRQQTEIDALRADGMRSEIYHLDAAWAASDRLKTAKCGQGGFGLLFADCAKNAPERADAAALLYHLGRSFTAGRWQSQLAETRQTLLMRNKSLRLQEANFAIQVELNRIIADAIVAYSKSGLNPQTVSELGKNLSLFVIALGVI